MPLTDRDADFYKVTLKSWLYEKIIQNQRSNHLLYPGLEWLDEQRRYFKLPWVTESHPEWEKYYKLFHEWASREGKMSTDSQKAKRNFRSALNHSKHFKHIEFMDQERQTESYKVYQFLTQEEIQKAKPRNVSEDSSASQQTPNSQFSGATPSNFVMDVSPNPVPEQGAMCEVPNDAQLNCNNLNVDPNFQEQQQWMHPVVQMPMNITDANMAEGNIAVMDAPEGDPEMCTSLIPSLDSHTFDDVMGEDKTKCSFTVEYNGKKVKCQEVSLGEGPCMIIYGDVKHAETVQALNLQRQNPLPIFPKQCITLEQPTVPTPGLGKILEHMNTGIHIWYDEGTKSFYLLRECLAHVYCFNMHEEMNGCENRDKALQINRKRHYKMFSHDQFIHDVCVSECSGMPKPSDTVEIVVGIQPKKEDRGRSVKGVKISVQFLGANKVLHNEDLTDCIKLSTQKSSLDLLVKQMKHSLATEVEEMQT